MSLTSVTMGVCVHTFVLLKCKIESQQSKISENMSFRIEGIEGMNCKRMHVDVRKVSFFCFVLKISFRDIK